MSLKNIIEKVSQVAGLDAGQETQRITLLAYINEAADAVWAEADINGSLMEFDINVTDGNTVVLPRDVLHVRAMIDNNIFQPTWDMVDMYKRYQTNQRISDLWFNWRDLGFYPVLQQPTVSGILHYTTPIVEDVIPVISMSCATVASDTVSEDISLSLINNSGTLIPTEILSLRRNITCLYNTTILDSAAQVLAVIPNGQLESVYHWFDVSSFPWNDTTTRSMKVLCKKKLPYFQNDNDQFPAVGYDYAIANKALEIWAINNQNSDQAAAYDNYTRRLTGQINNDQKRGVQETVNFGINQLDYLIPKPITLHRRNYPRWIS